MSIATGTVASSRRLFESPPVSIWVPLLVMVWVFVNVFLVRLGFRTGYQATCGLLAGGFDGSLLASIVLATLGDNLQAGTTGLLSGYGFHDAISKFGLTKQYLVWLHERSENLLVALLGPEEAFHKAVEYEALWMVSTAAVVVLATLIVQLIHTAGSRPVQSH